ncbi:MAG: ROK family protein [Spirochaeta sp.]|jgi:glucokinase|nr:ROK family protein [Spirochaeta sp.]
MQIGFDLGGTKMLAAVIDADGEIVARNKNQTEGTDNDTVYENIVETIDGALKKADISRKDIEVIGIAVPGPIDAENGVVLHTPNVALHNFPLAPRLSADIGCRVFLENDVNAGLWGEFIAGAGQGFRDVIGIFPGTGIGGGIVLDGRLYRGKGGRAGEIGHITVQSDGRRCGCGNHGCLETVASKTAIARDLALLAMNGQSPVLAEAGATDISLIKSGLIKKALDAGDPGVAEVVEQAARFLGIGMAAMVNIFDPELILLGGGLVEKLGARFAQPAETEMRVRAMPHLVEGVTVTEARLGTDAVIVGAADLARQR